MKRFLPFLFLFAGCQSAVLAAWEVVGYDKRHILVDRVENAREQQVDAQEQFQSTYEAFQALTGYQGGELESLYKKLKSEYEDAADEAEDVGSRIDSIEDVGTRLFEEWEEEADEITDPGLRANSLDQLRATRVELKTVVGKMRAAEATMGPVLTKFNDYVLALKHQLNAAAIGSLETTANEIGREIEVLIESMTASIKEADAFIERQKGES